MKIAGIIAAVILGAIMGAFVLETVLNFFAVEGGYLYGAIGGAILILIFAFVIQRGSGDHDVGGSAG